MIDDDGKQTRCGDMQSWMTMPDDTKENGQHDHGKCQGLQHHFAKSCCTENCAEGMAPAPSSSCSGRMDDEGYCQICDQGDVMADNMIDDDGKQTRCGDMQSWMTMPDDTKENGQHDHGKCQGLQHHFAKSCCTENCAESSMPIAPSSCSGCMNEEGYCQICDQGNVMQDWMMHEDGKDMRCGEIESWMTMPDDKGENAQHDHEGCQGLQRHYGKACCDHYCGDGSHMVGSARGQGVMLAVPLLALAAAAGF